MRKRKVGHLAFCLLGLILFTNLFSINLNVIAQDNAEEITPEFGDRPVIDGFINNTDNEWYNATKQSLRLYTNTSESDAGLLIDFWVLQNSSNLYICIKFSFEEPLSNEFVGFLISEDETQANESFQDLKFLQFSDLGGENQDYQFYDYQRENDNFIEDNSRNGDGAAQLVDNERTYEFSIPINNTEADDDSEDVFLDYGESYAFKIIFGNSDLQPLDYIKSNVKIIKIAYPTLPPEPSVWETVLLVFTIIIFSALGAFFGYYVYLVYKLKKRLKK